MLPAPAAAADNEQHPGWDSRSRLAPSLLTRPSDRAIEANNEQPADSGYVAAAYRRRQ